MNPTDKPRADAKIKTLPEERQADIADYARDHTLAETITWLATNGVQISSGPLSDFLSWYHLRRQLDQNHSAVQQIIAALKEQDSLITPEQLNEIGQKFFVSLAMEKRDPRSWYLAQQIACRKSEIQLDFQKYRDQLQARKEAIQRELDTAKSNGGLSPETIEKIEHELNLF